MLPANPAARAGSTPEASGDSSSGTFAENMKLFIRAALLIGLLIPVSEGAEVQDGDIIKLDVPNRTLNMDVSKAELNRRKRKWTPPPYPASRGYTALFAKHVTQAHEGCDFDFLHAGEQHHRGRIGPTAGAQAVGIEGA